MRQHTVTMDSKSVCNAFGLASRPISPMKLGQRKPKVVFTIIPQGMVGAGYQFLVSCDVAIVWDKIHSVFKIPKRQKLPITKQGKFPY